MAGPLQDFEITVNETRRDAPLPDPWWMKPVIYGLVLFAGFILGLKSGVGTCEEHHQKAHAECGLTALGASK